MGEELKIERRIEPRSKSDGTNIISKNIKDQAKEDISSIFAGSIITLEEAKELQMKRYITAGLIKEGQIVTVYGNAGAGKTSLILYFATKWIEEFGKDVLYINMDGDNPMSIPLQEKHGKKFLNIGKGSTSKIMPTLLGLNSTTLSDTVLIFDTYKKFTSDVNSKSANVTLFEQLRQLQGKGASIILLAHTNKDKRDVSGTADIEQDGDAMLRVNGAIEFSATKKTGTFKVSIKKGGRTRWEITPRSFRMVVDGHPDPQKCTELDNFVDMHSLENENEDASHIASIKDILYRNPFITTTELENIINHSTALSYREAKRVIYAYEGRHWNRHLQADKRTYKWSIIEMEL